MTIGRGLGDTLYQEEETTQNPPKTKVGGGVGEYPQKKKKNGCARRKLIQERIVQRTNDQSRHRFAKLRSNQRKDIYRAKVR